MTEIKIKQAIQEAIAEASNSNQWAKLANMGTAAAIAGTISLGLFFVIDARVDVKTSSLKISQAVVESQLKTANEGIDKLDGKFDDLMLLVLKSRKD